MPGKRKKEEPFATQNGDKPLEFLAKVTMR